jgi:cation-transporting ATPase I
MQVTVRRGGLTKTVFSDEVVDGEIIVLAPGDVIPSDCRLLMSNSLEVDESTLTGESLPVGKSSKPCDVDLPVADRTSMVYAGTTVVAGTGLAVTVATGSQTEAYRGLLLAGRPESRTGIEPRLEELTTMVTPAAVLAGLGVLGAGLARGHPMTEVLSGGVSLAVAAVPEGLPLLATAAQQASARRLARRGVVVRNVRAIEALGRVDVVCADKTGTLTLGRIRVKVVSDGRRDEPPSEVMAGRRRVLAMARAATPDPDSARRLPHPTDRAILYAVDDAGLSRRAEFGDWQRVSELPFEPGRGFHATLGDTADGRIVAVKGAPEVLLPRCAYLGGSRKGPVRATNEDHRRWQRKAEELASTGLRLLAVAETTLDPEEDLTDEALDELTFVGLIGLDDSVRESSREAVDDLARAGVKVLMITGDHPVTARGVAAELGLPADLILTGPELDRIDDVDLGERLERTAVCARVTPAHKVRIVRALKDRGHMVAMTGDGANDAPAIRLADVGIALGTRATDAARDASDLVVTDDRIETIVHAIVEGRSLWASVRDATAVLVGGNVGEMAFTLGGSLIAGIPPINTRQLLLINLLTDVLPAMAIAVSPPPGTQPEDFMALGPDTALGRELNQAVAERAVTTTVGATAGWLAGRVTGRRRRAGTIALASLVGTELGQTLATGWRSPLVVASCVGSWAALVTAVQTPGVSRLFGCTPLGPIAWSQALGSAGLATLGSTIWSAVRDLQPGEQEGEPEPAVEAVTAA